ncbi:hypothetical protein OH77DRAFT_1493171 [Trametes cingulata]|nr:hypothetical protein OH77DRAFT_1493171 [Trametes cingulata]
MQAKPSGHTLSKGSSTFLLESHSLQPGHSLLSNTPSFLGLKDADVYDPPPEPKPREPRPSLDSVRSCSTNRSVTVQRLALDLPLSRSSSLSVLLHALEDTAPGWYQSLMDSASPREASGSPANPPIILTPSTSTRSADADDNSSSSSLRGLPADMLASLEALEALALHVRQLPMPRPKTRLFEDTEAIFYSSGRSAERRADSSTAQLTSPPLTPTEEPHEPQLPMFLLRQRRATMGSHLPPGTSQSAQPSSDRTHHSAPSYRVHQVAATNIVNHPKLTKTLGLGSSNASRLPTPITPSRRQTMNVQESAVERTPPTVLKKASLKSLKAPKTPKALQSIFRPRPSAPPLPNPVPDYDEDDSPVRKLPLTYRFSEVGLRREDRRIDGIKRHVNSEASSRRPADPGSFLFM